MASAGSGDGAGALFRTGWTTRNAVFDAAGFPLEGVSDLLRPYAEQINGGAEVSVETARSLWMVLDASGNPVACVDTGGRLMRPDTAGIPSMDINDEADDVSLAASLATGLIHQDLARDVFATGDTTPGLGLTAVLSAFNRKERFFVTTQAAGLLTHAEIHGASLPLSSAWRRRLGKALGTEVPSHAFAVTDYHLSWLHAALSWRAGSATPNQGSGFSLGKTDEAFLVDGSQEDIDLLVCWEHNGVRHLVAVEAKAYGSWDNAQMKSKVARLKAILAAAQSGPEVDLRLVLTSRRKPQHLLHEDWPEWALAPDGDVPWMPLSAPGLRLATTRCDESGKASKDGTLWKITGPQGG